MARTRQDAKLTTESEPGIDVRWMKRNGYLQPGFVGRIEWKIGKMLLGSASFKVEQNRLFLIYNRRSDPSSKDVVQQVNLDWRPCNYGGKRVWFVCPQCRRRAAFLYGTMSYFVCRRCSGLTYQSQQEKLLDRLIRKAEKIRNRLGQNSYILTLVPPKPKGMHWQTYWRLEDEIEDIENGLISEMFIELGLEI